MTERPNIERDVGAKPGPQFLEVDGVTCFQFVLDSSNIVGPRKATRADKEEHKGAWEQFNAGRLPQLDRDFDGQPGGSLPTIDVEYVRLGSDDLGLPDLVNERENHYRASIGESPRPSTMTRVDDAEYREPDGPAIKRRGRPPKKA